MPQNIIRKAKIHAMNQDKAKYKIVINDENNKTVLRRALKLKVLMDKPEIFIKAFMIIHFPNLYYLSRK